MSKGGRADHKLSVMAPRSDLHPFRYCKIHFQLAFRVYVQRCILQYAADNIHVHAARIPHNAHRKSPHTRLVPALPPHHLSLSFASQLSANFAECFFPCHREAHLPSRAPGATSPWQPLSACICLWSALCTSRTWSRDPFVRTKPKT